MRGTTKRVGALALVAALLISMVGAGIAAAAAANVAFTEDAYTADETDDAVPVDIEVTADSDGISDETLAVEFDDADGELVHVEDKTIDVAPDETETFTVQVDATELGAGDYDAFADVAGETDGPVTFEVEEVEEPEVTLDADEYDIEVENGTTEIVATVTNPDDVEITETLEINVEDAENETVHTVTEDVTVAPEDEETVTVELESADLGDELADGDEYTVAAHWGPDTATATLTVTDGDDVFGGAVGDAANDIDALTAGLVVAVIALIALAARAD